jgi:myo-inositol-1(or 4)-monophosphatase
MQDFIEEIIREAGDIAKGYYYRGVVAKEKNGRHDLLTEADVAVSNFLVSAIHTKYPDHHIYSEEMAVDINKGAEYEWIIDPIDGTSNFAQHIPNWGILIALQKNAVTEYAATYWPLDDQLYTAQKNKGAFLNGTSIEVSGATEIAGSIGHYSAMRGRTQAENINNLAAVFFDLGVRTRNYGCMYNILLAARGVLDFYISNVGFDYDHVAPVLIAQEAGAVVTDCAGKPWVRGGFDMIIANPKLQKKLVRFVNV